MDIKTAQATSAIFAAIHTSTSIRLARGAAERKRVFEALQAKMDVQSYRYDWLQTAIHKCIGQMAAAAADFNSNHQFDQCSVQDLIDILEMAAEKLRHG